ncbi:hypothetical protein [Streptomyces sp. MJM8645]|uniref:hypothetical protein n=1 Tax=Streptomycetaceae TaxID=2062 RepID=UPI0007AFBD63|nr:hypothetical protein [Streptomyces sp. MJM8645]
MTTTPRSRKAAAAAEPVDPDSTMAEASTLVPAAAPLEPPAGPEPDPVPETRVPERVPVAEALPEAIDGLIVDSQTRRPPTDLDTLFERITPHGSALVSTIRLVENRTDEYGRTRTTLLAAQGAHLSESVVELLLQRLRDQASVRHAVGR